MSIARTLSLLLTLTLGCALAAGEAHAQMPDAAEPWDEARRLYGQGEYDAAARYIVEAIQRSPLEPRYYLGLARTENWRGNFDAAVGYYDIYLGELAQYLGAGLAPQDRLDRVREERDSANQEREQPDADVEMPSSQQSARRALDERIASGPILTETGGGAHSLYRSLLRTGYARPDLAEVRVRLADALLRELLQATPTDRAVMPVLSLRAWETQSARLDAWLALAEGRADVEDGERVWAEAMTHFFQGQRMALNGSALDALDAFEAAVRLDPGLLPGHLGRLNAFIDSGLAGQPDAAAALDEARAAITEGDGVRVGLLSVYALALQSASGDHEGAASALVTTLVGE